MAKVEIITRAFNRLEYTVLCVRDIDRLSSFEDYKHIIINQASTDGTKEWLDSLVKENYYKLKVKHNVMNTGDAGGMEDGFRLIDDDCEYIMQFDNDCRPITNSFLRELVTTMDENQNVGAIMMKREKVTYVIEPTNIRVIGNTAFGNIEKGTCCMILRRSIIQEYNWWRNGQEIGWGHQITGRMNNDGYEVLKAVDLRVEHIDGSSGQLKKYPNYFKNKTNKKSNFTKVEYK
jgi:glycosyltransferase involved in cell wall biosynthesis